MRDKPADSRGNDGDKRQRLRASIACFFCRSTKTKCDNDGQRKAPCSSCIKSKRECRYPVKELKFMTTNTVGGSKAFPHEGLAPETFADKLLSQPYFTEALWTEILEIFRQHFTTELMFIHLPTLKRKLAGNAGHGRHRRSHDTNLVLLGVLTLTARFHTGLVRHVASSIARSSSTGRSSQTTIQPDPWETSEFLADVLCRALFSNITLFSTERVQAFLMLGLYQWSQTRTKSGGLYAWMYVGIAIRMAQILGLCFEDSPGPRSPKDAKPRARSDEDIVASEVRRRTMFSCLVLDRMLSCGHKRLPAIRSADLQIRLPCSDRSFGLSEEIHTGFLRPTARMAKTPSHGDVARDSLLARFLCLVDIWGEISEYSFAGGRRAETRPPWEETRFRRLRGVLDDFYARLPAAFALSSSNYRRHESRQASGVYVSLHMLGSVCRIMLHREYIPFVPLRCPRPVGPLDEPTFPDGSAPQGFWEKSAEEVFAAARGVVVLIEMCDARTSLPMSALVAFAVWTAAFVGLYAWHFPQLDTMKHMALPQNSSRQEQKQPPDEDGQGLITRSGPTAVAFGALKTMSQWLQMASTYAQHFEELDTFYQDVKKEFADKTAGSSGPRASLGASVRLGGTGGGLDAWHVLGPKVTNNGIIHLGEDTTAADRTAMSGADSEDGAGSAAVGGSRRRRDRLGSADGDRVEDVDADDPAGNKAEGENKRQGGDDGVIPVGKRRRSQGTSQGGRQTQPPWMAATSTFAADKRASRSGQMLRSDTVPRVPVHTEGLSAAAAARGLPLGPPADAAGDKTTPVPGDAEMPGLQALLPPPATQGLLLPPEPRLVHPDETQRRPWHPGAATAAPPPPQPAVLPPAAAYGPQPPSMDMQQPMYVERACYQGVSGVGPYVDRHQGMRWQDGTQAADVGHFSQMPWDGPSFAVYPDAMSGPGQPPRPY